MTCPRSQSKNSLQPDWISFEKIQSPHSFLCRKEGTTWAQVILGGKPPNPTVHGQKGSGKE